MTIRKWTYMDIPRITEIESECFGKESQSFCNFADSFALNNFYGVCAEESGEIIGYGSMSYNGDDADIYNIAVTETFRMRGVGKKLLADMVSQAKEKKMRRMFLEVRVSNAPAQILYLKSGFVGSYVRPRYYQDGEDAMVMIKKILKSPHEAYVRGI